MIYRGSNLRICVTIVAVAAVVMLIQLYEHEAWYYFLCIALAIYIRFIWKLSYMIDEQ